MYALLAGFHKQVLQVEQRLLGRIHVDERGRDTSLPAAARATDLWMSMVSEGSYEGGEGSKEWQ